METVDDFTVPSVKTIRFHIGETEHTVKADDVGPSTTLNAYLREILHLTGTKKMCFEGGCGSCIVAVEETINGKKNVFAVNSCLVSILSCHGWKIHSNEGIGNPVIGYHNIQKLLAANNGTQCGFCSSGMVMNMYALQESGPITKKQIENSFGGNICRCTGYRPILEAFKKLASDTDYVPDIEELQLCQKEHCKLDCPGCPKHPNSFCLEFEDSKWLKVYNITDLLSVLRKSNTSNYMLVAGNTAKGVYSPSSTPDLYVDVTQIVELTNFAVNSNTLTLGANVPLTKVMSIFDSLSQQAGFEYLGQMRYHIDLIANVPVRNIGTLAGNLMIKYKHNEFQSDIFLLMVTFKATIVIVDLNGGETKLSAENFLKADMKNKVMKSIILNTLSKSYVYETYKIMPRAQNAHAIVNAGFLVKLTNDLVEECRIVYGGINPSFIRANKTEGILLKKKLYDNNTLMAVFNSLKQEVICDYVLPDPTPQYRQNLAISLFYKFTLKTAPSNLVSAKNASGGTIMERPVSSGTQEFGTQKQDWPLSEPITKIEALAQTSGQAQYIGDLPDRPHQLFAAFVTAEAAAGSVIQSTDTTEALQMTGVVAYYDYKDIPGENNITPAIAGYVVAEELFCSGTVKYYHQPIGIIVANDQMLAVGAASKVKVFYTAAEKKPVITIQQVLDANAKDRIKEQTTIVASGKGNDVKHVIKGKWYVKEQYHFHMEVQCCQVIPEEDGFEVHASSQWMDLSQISIANVLNISMNKIRVFVRRLGGAFGAKISRNCFLTSAAALAALKLNKPVKMWMPFENNMETIGKRYPFYVLYEVGVNDNGVIQYMDADLYSNYGVGGSENINVYLLPLFENCYDYSTWNFSTNLVNTDTPANTWMRAPGSLEGIGAIESIMEHISYVLNMDAMNVKLNNINNTLNKKLLEMWTTMQSWGEIAKRKAACKAFNEANRWKKKGISIVPMDWLFEVISNYTVLVSIYHGDGAVVICHGGIEMGQGINTKACQVAAYKFKIGLNKVSVAPSYNVVVANSFASGGSLTSEAVGYAISQACDILIERMKPVKEKLNNPSWEELINTCYVSKVLLSATGFFSEKEPNVQQYRIYGLGATEVEVDILTGQQQITRVDILEDVGDSMSPLIDIGQVEGAFVMGIGYYTSEDIIYNDEGKLMTTRTWNYKPPGAKDIPQNLRIKFPENNPNPAGILKAKAIGEPPICLSVSVPLAIRNAVASARIDADPKAEKWFPFDGPTTCENTFLNSLNSFSQYKL